MNQLLKKDAFFLIAGPCVIENEKSTLEIAEKIKHITTDLNIPFVFKASYKKANRTKLNSFTGIGDKKGLKILKKISEKFQIPVTTDVHSALEATQAAEYVDIIQIPAFLCRQTDILIAAAKTKKIVNIKKGQFSSPDSVKFMIEKITHQKNNNIIITERGNSFGYTDLIVDIRNIPIMQSYGKPVVLDITHSLQKPNQEIGISGGTPSFIETMGCAGIAANADGIFLETHPNPHEALSDGNTMLELKRLNKLLKKFVAIKKSIS